MPVAERTRAVTVSLASLAGFVGFGMAGPLPPVLRTFQNENVNWNYRCPFLPFRIVRDEHLKLSRQRTARIEA